MLISKAFLPAFLMVWSLGLSAQPEYRQIDHYLQMIRSEFNPEAAYRNTEYVSGHWRLPGNPGFDSSIYYVRNILEQAGFRESARPDPARLTYRIERRPLGRPAWEPVNASVYIAGEKEPLLQFSGNRNMIAINSFSTTTEGLTATLVYVPECSEDALEKRDVKGKIVLGDCSSNQLFYLAVKKYGAAGVLSYDIPSYNQPEKHRHSIPFSGVAFNSELQSWAVNLSYAARQRLLAAMERGPVQLEVQIETRFHTADELTLIAEIPGQVQPEERFVFSAHVQEPGANDNASGVGALAEMARVAALLHSRGAIKPARTMTFLWGDEIRATRRFIQEDEARARGIRWGVSLDMVGEDTEKTGGTFLIEKMPDPSAIWTRGADQHTEWGASPVGKEDFNPHYFNDLVEAVCRREALQNNWTVRTNPFEGGSDHQPFLDAGIPGLLFWHFTDVFYHTDADRIDKVSAATLGHVGASALACALLVCTGSEAAARDILDIAQQAAEKRLRTEIELSRQAIKSGKPEAEELEILNAWAGWYSEALPKVPDVLTQPQSRSLKKRIAKAIGLVRKQEAEGRKLIHSN